MMSQNLHVAICNTRCGTNKESSASNTRTCVRGWTGNNCLNGMVTYLIEIVIQSYNDTAICNSTSGTNKNVHLLKLIHVPVDGKAVTV